MEYDMQDSQSLEANKQEVNSLYAKGDRYNLAHSCIDNNKSGNKGGLRRRLHEMQKNNVTSQSQDSNGDKFLYI